MRNLINEICRQWWIAAGTELKNPRSRKSILALEGVLKDYGFDDIVVEYVIEAIVRTPHDFKSGEDTDTGVYVDDDETSVSAKINIEPLDDDELKTDAQLSEFNEEDDESEDDKDDAEKEQPKEDDKSDEEDEKQSADADIQKSSLTQYEKDKLRMGGEMSRGV